MTGALHALGPLGAASVLFSEMPSLCAWPLAMLALGYGYRLACREGQVPTCQFVWREDGRVTQDGDAIEGASLHWRGALAFMQFRTSRGRVRRLSWWPDTLDSRGRRELRLAIDRHGASRRPPRMAG